MRTIRVLDDVTAIVQTIKDLKGRLMRSTDPRDQEELIATIDMLHNSLIFELERFERAAS